MTKLLTGLGSVFNTERPVHRVFYYIFYITLIPFLFLLIITGGQAISFVFSNDMFMDFFNSVYWANNDPYSEAYHCIYPPFIMMFYSAIGWFFGLTIGDVGAVEMRESFVGMFTYCIITLIVVIFLAYEMRELVKRERGSSNILIIISMLISFPLMVAIARGNSILLVIPLIIYFLLNYNSDNNTKKLLSYVALGIAVGIKIYPVLFGLLIIKNKNIKDIIYAVLIGAAIFFIPFILCNLNISTLLNNIFRYTSKVHGIHSIEDIIYMIFSPYISDSIISIIGIVVTGLILLISVYFVFAVDMDLWKQISLISFNIAFGFNAGASQLIIYTIIPMVIFLCSQKLEYNKINILYAILFAVIASWFVIPFSSTNSMMIYSKFIAGIIMFVILLVEIGYIHYREKDVIIVRNKHSNNT